MIALAIQPRMDSRLADVLNGVGPAWRANLYAVGANALKLELRRYIRTIVPRHHTWATKLGGQRTMHLQKGAARITTWSSDDLHASVLVPIAGIQRAFDDLTIAARKAGALTIPMHGAAYGHRVAELRRMQWNIFRPKGKDYLMGTHGKDGEAELLYLLRKKIVVRKDRTLLPTDAQVTACINKAMARAIKRALDAKAA